MAILVARTFSCASAAGRELFRTNSPRDAYWPWMASEDLFPPVAMSEMVLVTKARQAFRAKPARFKIMGVIGVALSRPASAVAL